MGDDIDMVENLTQLTNLMLAAALTGTAALLRAVWERI